MFLYAVYRVANVLIVILAYYTVTTVCHSCIYNLTGIALFYYNFSKSNFYFNTVIEPSYIGINISNKIVIIP